MEHQENKTLSFLDTNMSVIDNKIEASIYRKPAFSRLELIF